MYAVVCRAASSLSTSELRCTLLFAVLLRRYPPLNSDVRCCLQGCFVAVIFCFANGEVVTLLQRKWRQWRLNNHGGGGGGGGGGSSAKHVELQTVVETLPTATVSSAPRHGGSSKCRHAAASRTDVTERLINEHSNPNDRDVTCNGDVPTALSAENL